jgi:uncharacterized protein
MTPQPAVVPKVDPAAIAGPVLPAGSAREPAKILQFPARAAASHAAHKSRTWLLVEFLALFGVLPLALSLPIPTLPRFALLWIAAAVCLLLLLRDPAFDRRQLWNPAPLLRQLPQILALFATGVVVISVLVRVYAPGLFLSLPRFHPRIWIAVLIAYPVLSVYPQGLVYRTWILHRYRPLLQPDPAAEPRLLILASAAAFAMMHLVFHNWVAIALTFPGGILFARHYVNGKSLFVSSIEHALYGCFLFTIGLGPFFALSVH